MATVTEIVKLSLKDIGVLGGRETPTDDEMQDALSTLNQMLAIWRTQTLSVYCLKQGTIAVDGSTSYTIGSGGDLNIERPVMVNGLFWRSTSNIDYPLKVYHSYEDYQDLVKKTLQALPCLAYYRPAYPTGELLVWPQPTDGTLYVTVMQEMPVYTTIQDDISLPPEYEGAIRWNLAEMLCASFGMPLTPEINKMAKMTKRALKINNTQLKTMRMPSVVLQDSRFSIVTGY
jgi:hypothetical protein